MKWGLRRYLNKDGTLNKKGKARFDKVSSNERLQKQDKKLAIRILKNEQKILLADDRMVKKYESSMNKSMKKSNENPTDKNIDKYEKKKLAYARQKVLNETYNRKISDIKSDKCKAGHDFVIERFGMPLVPYLFTRQYTYIEKP